jgi:opacity protein-like surface antigen
MKKLALASLLMLLSVSSSYALDKGGIFIEPMLTYETSSDGSVNFPAPTNNSDTTIRGWGTGARFGAHIFDIVFLGADGRYSIPKFKDSTLGQDTDSKSWNAAALVGVQMPWIVGLRAWGNWIFAGELDPDSSKNVDEKFKSASGWRLGAGLKVAIVSLNVEYQDLKYDKTDITSVGVFNTGFSSNGTELRNKSWIFSVSIPFGL